MKKIVNRLIFTFCLIPLSISNTQAAPDYKAVVAPIGFVHLVNNKAKVDNITGQATNIFEFDDTDIQKLIDKEELSYRCEINIDGTIHHIDYIIFLNKEDNASNFDGLKLYFAEGSLNASWLEFNKILSSKDGVTAVLYKHFNKIGTKKPTQIPGDYTLYVKRALPTFASKPTKNKHETHLPFEEIKKIFIYDEVPYKIGDSFVAYINQQVLAYSEDIKSRKEPELVLRIFWDHDEKEMKAVFYANEIRHHLYTVPEYEAPEEEHHDE